MTLDLLVRGGTVVDGSGGKRFVARQMAHFVVDPLEAVEINGGLYGLLVGLVAALEFRPHHTLGRRGAPDGSAWLEWRGAIHSRRTLPHRLPGRWR